MSDPVSGPLDRAELKRLADAPFGQAAKEIQKIDPFWGRSAGEKIKFRVTVRGDLTGEAIVMACSQEEADKLAGDLGINDIDWGCGRSDDFDIHSVEPVKEKK